MARRRASRMTQTVRTAMSHILALLLIYWRKWQSENITISYLLVSPQPSICKRYLSICVFAHISHFWGLHIHAQFQRNHKYSCGETTFSVSILNRTILMTRTSNNILKILLCLEKKFRIMHLCANGCHWQNEMTLQNIQRKFSCLSKHLFLKGYNCQISQKRIKMCWINGKFKYLQIWIAIWQIVVTGWTKWLGKISGKMF